MSALLAAWLAACPVAPEGLTTHQLDAACAVDERWTANAPGGAPSEELAAIYARPAFRVSHSSQAGDLFKRLKAWLETLFETSGAETYSNITRVVVLLLATFVVIAVVARLAGRRLIRRAIAEAPQGTALELADPAVHLARARALSSTDPRAGAREGLLAILAALERQRLARPDRVKTNRELARELPERGAPPDLVEAVSSQLSWFDRAWYSLEPLDGARAGTFIDDASALVARVSAFGVKEPAP